MGNGEGGKTWGFSRNQVLTAVVTGVVLAFGTALYGVIIGYPETVRSVKANEEEIEHLHESQDILEKNQRVIDEAVRDIKADSEWTQKKLDALMEAEGITKRIPRPKMKPSELEEVE